MDDALIAPEILTILGSNHDAIDGKKTRDRFTAEMKGRQARGKDVMTGKEFKEEARMTRQEKEDAKGDGKGSAKIDWSGNSDDAIERRGRAEAILANRELLTMYAQERGDSIASSRYHLQHIMCGIEDPRRPLKPGKLLNPTIDNLDAEISSTATISLEDPSVLDNNVIPFRSKEKNDCNEKAIIEEDVGYLGHEGNST